MARGPSEELRFDFAGDPDDRGSTDTDSGSAVDAAAELVAQVEKVHAVATQRRARHAAAREPWMAALFESPTGESAGGTPAPADATQPVEQISPAGGVKPRPARSRARTRAQTTALETDVPGDVPSTEERVEESLTVAQFYRRVRRALEGEFADEIWVTGEIRGLRERGGHRYIELADHGADTSARGGQQLEVTCWARDWPPVAVALRDAGVELEVGRVIRVRGRVSVWEGGGRLRFTLTALDVEALLGAIAAARRQLLRALEAEGLLDANRRLEVPIVPLRIGIVTSPGSEAHHDFVGQLERSGYAFEVCLEPSLVQGADAPGQLAAALGRLASWQPDLAVVVRGGGARGDLAAFDSELVARAIATAPFPVWSGVGHTGDRSVADEVANFATITPTACGEAVVQRVAEFEESICQRVGRLASLATARLEAAATRGRARRQQLANATRRQLTERARRLAEASSQVERLSQRHLESERLALERRHARLGQGGTRAVSAAAQDLERVRQVLDAYDPSRQLRRGWSLTHDASGHLLRSVSQVQIGGQLRTRLSDGTIHSVVAEVEQDATGSAGGARADDGQSDQEMGAQ
jgi:exodeoxyribonuclease VII large subunit